jgi:hypothetical protein
VILRLLSQRMSVILAAWRRWVGTRMTTVFCTLYSYKSNLQATTSTHHLRPPSLHCSFIPALNPLIPFQGSLESPSFTQPDYANKIALSLTAERQRSPHTQLALYTPLHSQVILPKLHDKYSKTDMNIKLGVVPNSTPTRLKGCLMIYPTR